MIYKIEISRWAERSLKKIPAYIGFKLQMWMNAVEESGLLAVRQISGFHDEPLKGDRWGQRSIRLNKAYRAIYVESVNKKIHVISVIEVSKHEY